MRKGAPKHVENVDIGVVTPRSVPETFDVNPSRKIARASSGERRAIGGVTPNASQVSRKIFFGIPPADSEHAPDNAYRE